MNCDHPYEKRIHGKFEALVPKDGGFTPEVAGTPDSIGEDVIHERAVACECGAILVPDGILVEEKPITFAARKKYQAKKMQLEPKPKKYHAKKMRPKRKPMKRIIRCACGRPLTQEYAIKMGECISCCLNRMRGVRTDQENILKERRRRMIQRTQDWRKEKQSEKAVSA